MKSLLKRDEISKYHDLGCSIVCYQRHPKPLSVSEYLYRTFDCSEYEKSVISPNNRKNKIGYSHSSKSNDLNWQMRDNTAEEFYHL